MPKVIYSKKATTTWAFEMDYLSAIAQANCNLLSNGNRGSDTVNHAVTIATVNCAA